MIHIFKKGTSDTTLCLFHGTGGTEHDLLAYASYLDPSASILSIRGNVLENGMNRYFRRIKEGVFDQVDLRNRSLNMIQFLEESSKRYQFDLSKMILVGYSNGANLISSMLFLTPTPYKAVILHHPMIPFKDEINVDLSGKQVLILAGTNDPLVKQEESMELERIYKQHQSNVCIKWFDHRHTLSSSEINETKLWYDKEIMEK